MGAKNDRTVRNHGEGGGCAAQNGAVSSSELIDAALERIDQTDGVINALHIVGVAKEVVVVEGIADIVGAACQ